MWCRQSRCSGTSRRNSRPRFGVVRQPCRCHSASESGRPAQPVHATAGHGWASRREKTMTKTLTRRGAVGLSVLSAALLVAGQAPAQNRAFSFAYDQPTTTAYGIAANIFDAKLKEASGGKFSINQFPGAQLGQEPQALQKMRAGDID